MRKYSTTLGLGLVALALLLGSTPARAGEASWNDPEGDATGYLVSGSTPRPSEPVYDVLGSTLTSDGKDIRLISKFKALGTIPPQATGNVYRLNFIAGEAEYTLSVIQDRIAGDFSVFSVLDTTTNVNMQTDCVKCTGKLDAKSGQLTVQIPIASLESARRSAQVAAPKIGPGTKLEEVNVSGGEYYNLGYRIPGVTETTGGVLSLNNTADAAAMPAPGTFTI